MQIQTKKRLTGAMTNIIYKYGIGTALVVLWSMGIVSYATYQIFLDVTKITASVVAAYSALLGLPTVTLGLYKWRNTDASKRVNN